MLLKSRLLRMAMVAALGLCGIGTALASESEHNDAAELAKLPAGHVTLAAAIATAERQTSGQAIDASFGNENGTMLIEVEVAKGNAVHTVKLDAANGKVIKVTAADEDEDAQHEHEHEGEQDSE
jgi:Peptidase propeptide and YPEB domain